MALLKTSDDLAKLASSLRLVSTEQIGQCLAETGTDASARELLQGMQNRQLLTPFQSDAITKGEAGALLCGHYKLTYHNASGTAARVLSLIHI